MHLGHVLGSKVPSFLVAKSRDENPADDAAVVVGGLRLQVDVDVLSHKAVENFGDRRGTLLLPENLSVLSGLASGIGTQRRIGEQLLGLDPRSVWGDLANAGDGHPSDRGPSSSASAVDDHVALGACLAHP